MTYSILYHEEEGGREWLFHHIAHESQITCKLQSPTFKLCHVDSSGTTFLPTPLHQETTANASFHNAAWWWVKGEDQPVKPKAITFPADKEKPKSKWRAEWAERLQEPYGQLQLVSLTWRRAPGQRPMLGAVHPQPFLAKCSSISGNLPALPVGYPEILNSDMSPCCLKSYVLFTFLE